MALGELTILLVFSFPSFSTHNSQMSENRCRCTLLNSCLCVLQTPHETHIRKDLPCFFSSSFFLFFSVPDLLPSSFSVCFSPSCSFYQPPSTPRTEMTR
ncbi:hypothetical protein F5X96DRAFT_218105 [Biscogniauxia mediterranea]|nr:hypothetical protein F5X96DRAFT_218105 [Biscogniauxia mediterranea]